MINLDSINAQHQEDLESVNTWCDNLYEERFASHFKGVRELYDRLKSTDHPITDEELMWILTELPIELFNVSTCLNEFVTNYEVLKLKIRKKETQIRLDLPESRRKDAIFSDTFEDKLLLSAYNSVATRVDRELAFSRELIMGAKKVWDSRRHTEDTNPISEVNPGDDLPDYCPTSKTYIQG